MFKEIIFSDKLNFISAKQNIKRKVQKREVIFIYFQFYKTSVIDPQILLQIAKKKI